jgi:hypothetical protein
MDAANQGISSHSGHCVSEPFPAQGQGHPGGIRRRRVRRKVGAAAGFYNQIPHFKYLISARPASRSRPVTADGGNHGARKSAQVSVSSFISATESRFVSCTEVNRTTSIWPGNGRRDARSGPASRQAHPYTGTESLAPGRNQAGDSSGPRRCIIEPLPCALKGRFFVQRAEQFRYIGLARRRDGDVHSSTRPWGRAPPP